MELPAQHPCHLLPLPPPTPLPLHLASHLAQEVLDPLVVTYVASHPNSAVVLARLWPLNRDVLLRAMVALYHKDTSNVARVLDVCQVRQAQAAAGGVGEGWGRAARRQLDRCLPWCVIPG